MKSQKIARNTLWKVMYINRLKNLHREQEITVGEPPEYKITIHIYGDGRCYVRKSLSVLPEFLQNDDIMRYLSSSDSDSDGDESGIGNGTEMIPIREYKVTGHKESGFIEEKEIIDVHAANNTVLLLCQDGKVLEMMFTPSWVQGYDDYHKPTLVEFPQLLGTDEYITMIRTLSVGNFAISNKDKIFVWTLIEHPITMEKIHTPPLHMHQLQEILSNIYDMDDSDSVDGVDGHDSSSYTRIYYRDFTGKDPMTGSRVYDEKYIDISNNQIMMLVMENYFSLPDIERITQTIHEAENT